MTELKMDKFGPAKYWLLGCVKWFGGYNKSTNKDNDFGFLQTNGNEDIFFHKNEICNQSFLKEGNIVLYEIGTGKNGKKCAHNVCLLSINSEQSAEIISQYLIHSDEFTSLNQGPIMDFIIKLFDSHYGASVAEKLSPQNARTHEYLSLMKASCQCAQLLSAYVAPMGIIEAISRGISPSIMPKEFIDDHIIDFTSWMKNVNSGKVVFKEPLHDLITNISFSAIVYLGFNNAIDATEILNTKQCDLEDFVERQFTKEKTTVADFVRDAYQTNFSSFTEYSQHPIIRPFMEKCLVKKKMFLRDMSFADDVLSSPALASDPEFYILAKLLPLINPHNNYETIVAAIVHEVWHALLNKTFDVDHPSIFKLFPRCHTLESLSPNIKLSCEAFYWKTTNEADKSYLRKPMSAFAKRMGTYNELVDTHIFICRSKRCDEHPILPDLRKSYIKFNIYDWLSHYGVNYMSVDKPSQRDFPIKLAGYLNRIREIYHRLHCRCCGSLMMPNMDYARNEVPVFDATTNSFVTKPNYAAYRMTVFKCGNENCTEYNIDYYINHCIGFKCYEIIDSRDLKEKCSEGRYICKSCGSCCKHHQKKYGNVHNGEPENVKYQKLYDDSPFFFASEHSLDDD